MLCRFMVIGSTGNNYQVTLTDDKRKCQCMDHRIRRHDCKHIRLILANLNCVDAPQNWRQVCAGAAGCSVPAVVGGRLIGLGASLSG